MTDYDLDEIKRQLKAMKGDWLMSRKTMEWLVSEVDRLRAQVDNENILVVDADEWDELNEKLERPAREIPELRKLLRGDE